MSSNHTLSGPRRGNVLFGNALEFARNPPEYLEHLVRTYGDFVRFHILTQPVYLVNDPELVYQVLVKQADKFYKQALVKRILKRFLGNGLLFSDGDFWRRQRHLAQPAFHSRRIESYAQMMVDSTVQMLAGWQSGQIKDIQAEMMALTLQIVSQALFHTDVQDTARDMGSAFTTLNELIIARLRAPLSLPGWLPTRRNWQERRAVEFVDALIMARIRERRASGEDQGDLLSMLLLAHDQDGGQMSDQQVRDELMTLVFAGHETTAVTLSWAFYELAQNPQIQSRLLDELATVLGERLPTLDDLANLPYTEMVVKEVMRRHTAVWLFSREAREKLELDGHVVPKGRAVFVSPYVLHRDERYFPDPLRFDPDRFSPENEQRIPRFAYIPFSSGPRVCIGNAFAMMEMCLVLATIVPRFGLKLAPGHDVQAEALMTQRVKSGLPMELIARDTH